MTVTAAVTCSQDAQGYLFAELRQRVGRSHIYGYGETWVSCGPDATDVTLTTYHESGVFAGGQVLVRGASEVFSDQGYGFTSFEETVRARVAS